MPFVVVGADRQVTDDNRIFATALLAQGRASELGAGYTAITTEAPDDIEPGWSVSNTSPPTFRKGAYLTDAQEKTAYKLRARAHAEECLDLLPAWWGREGKDGANPRWEASYYHILGGAAIVTAAANATGNAAYTVAQLGQLFTVYQTLCPAVKGDLHDWHFEANVADNAGWTVYTSELTTPEEVSGKIRAYLKVTKTTLTPVPDFKSDSQTSQAWDGTNNTLSVVMEPDDTPLDVTT